jgi:hypothetical protein
MNSVDDIGEPSVTLYTPRASGFMIEHVDAIADAGFLGAHDGLASSQRLERQTMRAVDPGRAQHDAAHAALSAPDSRHFLCADAPAGSIRAGTQRTRFIDERAGGVPVDARRAHIYERAGRDGCELQEAVEPQIAFAQRRRRGQIDDCCLIEPLGNSGSGADAIEVERERTNPRARELRDAGGGTDERAHVEAIGETQREAAADVAAAHDQHVITRAAHRGPAGLGASFASTSGA